MSAADQRSLGPIARGVFARLQDEALPSRHCTDLLRQRRRVWATWDRARVTCPGCAATSAREARIRADADISGLTCDGCSSWMSTWTPIHQNLGALVLMAALCPACTRSDEAAVCTASKADAPTPDRLFSNAEGI